MRSILNERDIEAIKRDIEGFKRLSLLIGIVAAIAVPAAALVAAFCPRYEWQQAAQSTFVLRLDKWGGEAAVCEMNALDDTERFIVHPKGGPGVMLVCPERLGPCLPARQHKGGAA